jgi:TP901 family phage tail tape measure protein
MAVFTNELKLDVSSFIAQLKKAASDTKGAASEIAGAVSKIKVGVDTEGATKGLAGLKSKFFSTGKDLGEEAGRGASGGFSDAFKGALSGGLLAGAGTQIVGNLFSGVGDAISNAQDFEKNLKALSAVTGVTGSGLDDLGLRARDLAKEFGGSANEQLKSFQGILSKFGPGLAGTPEALTAVSKNINILAAAGGINAQEAMSSLTDAMLQFGVNVGDADTAAAESSRFINVLAASAQVGAAEIPQVAQSILQAGVAAKGANLSFEETNSALQVLAVGGKVGSEAGIALRNVLGLLQKQSGPGAETLKKLGLSVEGLGQSLTTQGLEATLRQLGDGLNKVGSDAERNAALMNLFGAENASAAGILLENVDSMKAFTEGVTGTNSATEQAAINLDTFSARLSQIKANVEDAFIDAFQSIAPIVSKVIDDIFPRIQAALSSIFSALAPVFTAIGLLIGGALFGAIQGIVGLLEILGNGFKVLEPIIPLLALGIAAYAVAINASVISTKIAAAATAAWNAILAANPVGLVVVAVVALIAAVGALNAAFSESAESRLQDAENTKKTIEEEIKLNNEKKTNVLNTKKQVAEYEQLAKKTNRTAEENKKLRDVQGELDKQYPDLIDQTKSFEQNLAGVAEIGKQTSATLGDLTKKGDQLAKQLAESNKAIAEANRDIAIEALDDVIGFWTKATSAGARRFASAFDPIRAEFARSLSLASTEEQIDAAENKIREFVNSQKAVLDDPEKLLEIYGAISKAVSSQRTAVKALAKDNKEAADAAGGAAAPTPASDAAAKKSVAASKTALELAQEQFKAEEARLKLQQENAITALRAAVVAGDLTTDQEKTKLKEVELKTARETLAAYEKIFGVQRETLKIDDQLSTDIVREVKFKVNNDQLVQIRTQFQNFLQQQLTLELGVRPNVKDLEKGTLDAIKKIEATFKDNADDLADNAISPESFRTSLAGLQGSFDAIKKSLQDALTLPEVQANKELTASNIEQIDLVTAKSAELATKGQESLDKAFISGLKGRIELNKLTLSSLQENEQLNADEILRIQRELIDQETNLKLASLKSTGELRNAETKIILDEAAKQRAALDKTAKGTGGAFDAVVGGFTQAIAGLDFTGAFDTLVDAGTEAAEKTVDALKAGTLDYQSAVAELESITVESTSFLDTVLQRVADSFAKIRDASIASLRDISTGFDGSQQAIEKLINATANAAASGFAQILLEGESFGKGFVLLILDILDATIPALVALILGQSLAANPLLGAVVSAALIATLKAAVAVARSAAQGFESGGYTGNVGTKDVAGVVHGQEFVINARATKQFRPMLEEMNKGRLPMIDNGEFSAMRAELSAIRRRLDGMPNGIQGSQAMQLNVGFDNYIYERDRRRSAVRGLRG